MSQALPAPAAREAADAAPAPRRSPFWRKFLGNRLGLVGTAMALLMVLIAIFAPWIAPHNPTAVWPNGLQPDGAPLLPDWQWSKFFLGTDPLGRDELSQLIWGARVSMEVGIFATAISLVIGTLVGSVAGLVGGWLDNVIMRVTDVFLAFPFLLFVILLESVIAHPTVVTVYLVVGLLGWASVARIARGQAMAVARLEYVEAARAVGAPFHRLIVRYIIPNILSPLIVVASLAVANNIVFESALSFLGIGVPDPTPSWGKMIAAALGMYQVDPWLLVFPGIFLVIATLGFNLMGDALNQALNPRQPRRFTA